MLTVGEVIRTDDKVSKPKTVHERLIAEDDGLIHDGTSYTITAELPTSDADTSRLFMAGPALVAKIAERPVDNDLRENEAKVLTTINAGIAALANRNSSTASTFQHYFPRLVGSVKYKGLACNLLSHAEGCVSIADILRAYPKGIDFRDMIWMLKRLLIAVGYVHSEGLVHGSIIPAHVLVHPEKHGAFLVGWSSAVPKNGRVTIMSRSAAAFYAPEILEKRPATSETDIFMVFKVAEALLGTTDVPDRLRAFFVAPLEHWSRNRPPDAWAVHDDLDKLLLEIVGKPAYRRFHMPSGDP